MDEGSYVAQRSGVAAPEERAAWVLPGVATGNRYDR